MFDAPGHALLGDTGWGVCVAISDDVVCRTYGTGFTGALTAKPWLQHLPLAWQVAHFSLQQYKEALEHFRFCSNIRTIMCDVPHVGSLSGRRGRPAMRPWEDRLPHPELAASYVNVTVRGGESWCEHDLHAVVVGCF